MTSGYRIYIFYGYICTPLFSLFLPALEFPWSLFSGCMEVQRYFSIDSNTKIIVHYKYRGCILILIFGFLFLLVWMEDHSPPKQSQEKLYSFIAAVTFKYRSMKQKEKKITSKNIFLAESTDVITHQDSFYSYTWSHHALSHLSSFISSASITSLSKFKGSSPPVYPGPQRKTRAKSLPTYIIQWKQCNLEEEHFNK